MLGGRNGSGPGADSLGNWHGPPPAWGVGRPRLLVLPFAAHDYDGYQAVYARRLAEWLASRLHASEAVDAAFPLLVGEGRDGRAYAALTRVPEPERVRAQAASAGAEWVLFGRLNLVDQVEWELYLLEVATGELAFGEEAHHPPERALEALSVVGLQLLRVLGRPPLDDEARSRLFGSTTRSPEALQSYLLAADLLAHPARTEADVSNGLTYAFNAVGRDADFHAPADLIMAEALRRLEGDETQTQSGLHLLRRLTELAPGYHKVPAAVGMVWQRGGDHDQAVRAYREALRLSPGHPYHLFRLGLSLDALDDPEALPTLEAAVAADPANRAAQDLLGARLADGGRLDEAVALWQRQLDERPDHAPALTNLATARAQAGDEAGAADHFERALRASASYAPALDRYADLLARQGRHAQAIELLERLARARQGDPLVLERLARSLGQANRPEQELNTLNRLVALRPDYWPALQAIALRQRQLGRADEAIAAYYRLLKLNPDHLPALVDLGYLLGLKRQLTEAARLLGHAHALAPDDPGAAYNYAVVQLERGEWVAAERLLERVKEQTPDDPLPDRVLAELARRRRRGY